MNFEIREKDKNKPSGEKLIYHNNEKIGWAEKNGSQTYIFQIDTGYTHLFYDYDIKQLIDFNVDEIWLPVNFEKYPYLDWMDEYTVVVFEIKENKVYITGQPELLKWNKSINISAFLKKLEQKAKGNEHFNFEYDEKKDVDNLFLNFFFPKIEIDGNIKTLFDTTLYTIHTIVKEIFTELLEERKYESVISSFTFPQEVQSACEQYLIYFSKFLEDLGIQADTSIESKRRETLFTVTPKNSTDALIIIRDALNIYLKLPTMPNIDTVAQEFSDIGVKQLVANIYHLKSQLIFAHSTIQMKDATIESLQFTNQNIQRKLDKKSSNEETFFGVVSIDQFEFKGIKINLAEIFRKLKRSLK